MKNLYYRLLKYINRIESKIAFYPTLLSLGGVLFTIIMYYAENQGVSGRLLENLPWLVIDNVDTARLILSTFIGGLISIMVFSFSMVMILLNNASNNFSPRVLPGIISNKRHQIILGVFNASLLYCIFTLISIIPKGDEYQLPGFSVLISIVFMITCLGMFIYFIHSISQEIQVNNVMKGIYRKAYERLEELIQVNETSKIKFPSIEHWHGIYATRSGYLQDVALNPILKKAKEQKFKISIVPIKGDYIFEGDLLMLTDKKIDSDLAEKLSSNFVYSSEELVEENYVLGFKQITEIAVKAMSPGINDPGTCINAIDYLTELFLIRMRKSDHSYLFNEDEALVEVKTADFKVILYNVMASLRTYITHDIIINNKLISMLTTLLKSKDTVEQSFRLAILVEIDNLYQDVLHNVKNERDIKLFEKRMEPLKDLAKI